MRNESVFREVQFNVWHAKAWPSPWPSKGTEVRGAGSRLSPAGTSQQCWIQAVVLNGTSSGAHKFKLTLATLALHQRCNEMDGSKAEA